MDEEVLQAGIRSRPVQIHGLLSAKQLSSFATLLAAYRQAGIPLQDAIDGGAGAGHTASQMLRHLDGEVFAFEPFPGNHRFFEDCDPRINLIPKALADANKRMPFRVGSVVSADSEWGRKGMEGYSSTGMLVTQSQAGTRRSAISYWIRRRGPDPTVQCVRADHEIPQGHEISFVKLDLQGGELNALKGMTNLLPEVLLMWIEYEGQPGLLDYLADRGFVPFDTEYTFVKEPTPEDLTLFDVSEGDALSTGQRTWKGFKREPSPSSDAGFARNKPDTYYVWTDLVCVNRARFDEFQRALHFL